MLFARPSQSAVCVCVGGGGVSLRAAVTVDDGGSGNGEGFLEKQLMKWLVDAWRMPRGTRLPCDVAMTVT